MLAGMVGTARLPADGRRPPVARRPRTDGGGRGHEAGDRSSAASDPLRRRSRVARMRQARTTRRRATGAWRGADPSTANGRWRRRCWRVPQPPDAADHTPEPEGRVVSWCCSHGHDPDRVTTVGGPGVLVPLGLPGAVAKVRTEHCPSDGGSMRAVRTCERKGVEA